MFTWTQSRRLLSPHDNKFNDWFKNTLNVNENYVIYTRNEDLSLLKLNRENLKIKQFMR